MKFEFNYAISLTGVQFVDNLMKVIDETLERF